MTESPLATPVSATVRRRRLRSAGDGGPGTARVPPTPARPTHLVRWRRRAGQHSRRLAATTLWSAHSVARGRSRPHRDVAVDHCINVGYGENTGEWKGQTRRGCIRRCPPSAARSANANSGRSVPYGSRRFHPSGNGPPVPPYGDRPVPLARAIPWAYPSARRSVFLLVQPASDRTSLHHPRVTRRRFESAEPLPFGGQWPDSIRVRRKPAGLVIPSPASPRT